MDENQEKQTQDTKDELASAPVDAQNQEHQDDMPVSNCGCDEEDSTDISSSENDDDASADDVSTEEAQDAQKPPRKPMSRGLKRALIIISGVIVVLAGLVLTAYLTRWPQKNLTAFTVGKIQIKVDELNFLVRMNAVSVAEKNAEVLDQLHLDLSKPFGTQKFPQEGYKTWLDFFVAQAKDELQLSAPMADMAEKQKIKLTSQDMDILESILKQYQEKADKEKLSLNAFLEKSFGCGVDVQTVNKAFKRLLFASRYQTITINKLKFSDAQIEDYYKKNKADLDVVTFHSFKFDALFSEKDAVAKAKNKAETIIASVTDSASFDNAAKKYFSKDQLELAKTKLDITFVPQSSKTDLADDAVSAWLFNNARKDGDKAVVQTGDGVFAIYLDSRTRNIICPVSVRHILIMPEKAKGANDATPAQIAAAKKKAEDIYNQFLKTKKMESDFAKLAIENTQDTRSKQDGGLISNFMPKTMVAAFDEWSFSKGHKKGDTGIVQTEYGFHIMYFVSSGEPTWLTNAKNGLLQAFQTQQFKEIKDKNPIKDDKLGAYFTVK